MRTRRWLALVSAAAVLLGAEAGARAVSGALPSQLRWGSWEAQLKAEKMDEIARRGGRASFVFVGSSMTDVAFDPERMDLPSRPGEVAFNAALFATSAKTMDLWTRNVVYPKLRPRTVVIGVSTFELNDNGPTQKVTFDNLARSQAMRHAQGSGSLSDRVGRALSRHSALIEHRDVLRHPELIAEGKSEAEQLEVSAAGVPRAFARPDFRSYQVKDAFKATARQTYGDFHIGGPEFQALERAIAFLRERKVDVVVVKMPLTRDAVNLHPRGATDYALFESLLRSVVAEYQVPLIEVDTADAGVGFYDPLHLNSFGRGYIMDSVAQALATIDDRAEPAAAAPVATPAPTDRPVVPDVEAPAPDASALPTPPSAPTAPSAPVPSPSVPPQPTPFITKIPAPGPDTIGRSGPVSPLG